jgi:hypothetical protein
VAPATPADRPALDAVANSAGPKANGQGAFDVGTQLRTFAFNAVQQKDGEVYGHAELHNRTAGAMLHMDVDCLNIIGNMAVMSGPITSSNVPGLEGLTGIFTAVDNGEGDSNDTDMLSLAYFFAPGTLTCRSGFTPPPQPIEYGNIQVKP